MTAARRRRDQGAEEASRDVFRKARRIKKQFSDEQLNVLVSAMYYEIEHVKDTLGVADELYDLFAAAQGEGKTT